ncbi:hypothetical protein IV52_GL001112 [Fructilactobacillus lindneri DSM 20690 = JCM 11027]|uniref:Abortive phage infection protein C-terminal domain-containing protein n=2 Tax=Fructilactobacillus lindneri TaxID=53444 RepID=A0A0R2JNU3_9LACO|nr:hypothetical protein IV52_GL001112 [Fructilactobacillus lindneri DSM 20690 = JCM 11027]
MNQFKEKMELKNSLSEESLFESFSTYCIISKLMDNDFSYDDIDNMIIDGGNDGGIDTVGFLINGEFINNKQELDDILANKNQKLNILMILIQSKISPKFEGSKMRTFGDGISDILKEKPSLIQNNELKEKWEMTNEIINNFSSSVNEFKGRAYYVTTGKWFQEDKNLKSKISNIKSEIDNLNVFDNFEFKPIDASQLREYFKESNSKVKKQINFDKKVVIPDVSGVKDGWLGFLNGKELIKLIVDDNGDLRRSLFYDNVRDFQGETKTNNAIKETINSDNPEDMSILNNGITIVADNAKTVRSDLVLENYQIVNGCQTSYVMYQNRDKINENSNIYVPVKIIVPTSPSISTKITISNNRQTAVKEESLLALTEVQKELESYFNTFKDDKNKRLFYERRSNQYNSSEGLEKVRIVPMAIALRSYSSMFLGIPHYASRYYGRLYKDFSEKVFDIKNPKIAFYTSSYALYKYNFYIRNSIFERKYAKFKYFILFMINFYITGNIKKPSSSKETERECNKINKILWDNERCKNLMQKMIDIIDKVAGSNINSNELTSKKYFSDDLIEEIKKVKEKQHN